MPRAVVRAMPWRVNIDGVITVGGKCGAIGREHAAYFLQNRRSARGMRGSGRHINEMSEMRDAAADRATGAGILVTSFGVVAAANTLVPGIQTTDLIADKSRICPACTPEDARGDCRR